MGQLYAQSVMFDAYSTVKFLLLHPLITIYREMAFEHTLTDVKN